MRESRRRIWNALERAQYHGVALAIHNSVRDRPLRWDILGGPDLCLHANSISSEQYQRRRCWWNVRYNNLLRNNKTPVGKPNRSRLLGVPLARYRQQ